MRRSIVALMSAAVIVAGSFVLSTPAPLKAEEVAQACCTSGTGAECCGRECKANADSCKACSTWFTCLFF